MVCCRDRFLEKELWERRVLELGVPRVLFLFFSNERRRGGGAWWRTGGMSLPTGAAPPGKSFRFCVLSRWILVQNECFCKIHLKLV